MGDQDAHAWALTRRQHNMVARPQLLALGFTSKAIKHRVARGRLHLVWPGVYSVGTPYPSRLGLWMGAVLNCGESAALSDWDAAALFGLRQRPHGPIHVSVLAPSNPRGRGIVVHRRRRLETITHLGIPVTTPAQTIADIARGMTRDELEQTINQADVRGVVEVAALRTAVEDMRTPGAARVRATIDRLTFTMTRSRLERWFLPIAARAGLPPPRTCVYVNGYEVDFHWPELGLVVETDGGTFHRTAAQQAQDRRRDHAHTLAGLRHLRFTHGQVRYEPGYVEETLARVAARR
jgi:Protein of unknown function (DUF559)